MQRQILDEFEFLVTESPLIANEIKTITRNQNASARQRLTDHKIPRSFHLLLKQGQALLKAFDGQYV